ncbi:MAG: cell division protein ZapA [Candidatus Latescibacterota bacterium]|nr:cell division protein ZapA [Candidatus Latescibacterota bacterium]
MSSNTVANIFGKNYTLVVDQDHPADLVQQIAQLVDERMHQVKGELRAGSPLQVAILANLNLVEELLSLQEDYASTESDIAQRTSRLTAALGRLFAEVEATDSAS